MDKKTRKQITELHNILKQGKELIYHAKDIECRIDFPFCHEFEAQKSKKIISEQLTKLLKSFDKIDSDLWCWLNMKDKKDE